MRTLPCLGLGIPGIVCLFTFTAYMPLHSVAWINPFIQKSPLAHHELPFSPPTAEVASILRNAEHLQAYARQPGCFQLVAKTIRVRCEELEMDEQERVKAAISMTLCELRTALHPPPMECSHFAEMPGKEPKLLPGDHNICVEALSRSAQYWSSYSGYLREVPQLCFAFRRWNDIDTAKEIYRNATMDGLELVHLLLDRERKYTKSQEDMDSALEGMRVILGTLNTMSTTMGRSADEAARAAQSKSVSILETLQTDILHSYKQNEDMQQQAVRTFEAAIHKILAMHADSLLSLIPSLDASIETRLEVIFSSPHQQLQGFLDSVHLISQEWGTLGREVAQMRESLRYLTSSAHSAMARLDLQTGELVNFLNLSQQSTADSTSRLAVTLQDLITKTEDGIGSINDTAAAVRAELELNRRTGSLPSGLGEWCKDVIFWLLSILLRVDLNRIDHLWDFPFFRALCVVASILGYFLRVFSSIVMSWVLIFISARRWFTPEPVEAVLCKGTGTTKISLATGPRALVLTPRPNHWHRKEVPGEVTAASSQAQGPLRMSRVPNRLLMPSVTSSDM